jgi:hypothetical protein
MATAVRLAMPRLVTPRAEASIPLPQQRPRLRQLQLRRTDRHVLHALVGITVGGPQGGEMKGGVVIEGDRK